MQTARLLIAFLMLTKLWGQDQLPPIPGQTPKNSSASITFKASYLDTYIFRGHVFDEEPSTQGELTAGISSWSYNLFYSDPSEDTGIGRQEYNHSVSFTMVAGNRITTTGYRYFDYEDAPDRHDTQEFFYRTAYRTRWNPTYGVAYDFDTYKGYYVDLSVTRSFPFTQKSELIFSLYTGFAYDMEEQRGAGRQISEPAFYGKDGFTHGYAVLNYHWRITRKFKFESAIEYHHLADDFLTNNDTFDDQHVAWKTSFTLSLP